MDEGSGRSARRVTAKRLGLLALAVATWLAGFVILSNYGTWTPFAVAGPALAGLTLWLDLSTRRLLEPSWRAAIFGLLAGAVMTATTYGAFAAGVEIIPELRGATHRLFDLLEASTFSNGVRAVMISAIAASEEIVFRGAILGGPPQEQGRFLRSISGSEALRIVVLAGAYAAAMATLASALVLLLAFACAVFWGFVRVATRSLIPPIVAHVVWDLSILVVWPLV